MQSAESQVSQIQELIETYRQERNETKAAIDAVYGQIEDLLKELDVLSVDQTEDSLKAILEALKGVYEPVAD